MSAITGLLYGALAVFLGGWYLGFWSGNFSLLLFVLTLSTFGYWLAERLHFLPQRVAAASALETQDVQRRAELHRQGITQVDATSTQRASACSPNHGGSTGPRAFSR